MSDINRFGKDVMFDLSQHWLRYITLIVTGSLTGLAAWSYTSNPLMVLALISLAEGASLYWSKRVEDYGNWVQATCAGLGALLAWLAIIVTDLASATIIASKADIEIFTAFREVPVWAQRTVVYVIPALAVVHGVLATIHYFFSEIASMRRSIAADLRKANHEIAKAKSQSQVDIARAEAERYAVLAQNHSQEVGYLRAENEWKLRAGIRQYQVETVNPTPPPSKK